MHKLHMHYGVALLSGCSNRSAKLGWQNERARPARSYCQPTMHFFFILQIDYDTCLLTEIYTLHTTDYENA